MLKSEDYLGRTYRDAITGFQGIAIGVVSYITGCDQVLLQPRSETNDKKPDAEWIDVDRLDLCERIGRLELTRR